MYIGNMSLSLSFFPYYWIFFKHTFFFFRQNILVLDICWVRSSGAGLSLSSVRKPMPYSLHVTERSEMPFIPQAVWVQVHVQRLCVILCIHSLRGILMNWLKIKLSNGNWLQSIPVFLSLSQWWQHSGVKAAIKRHLFKMHTCGFKGKVMNVKRLPQPSFHRADVSLFKQRDFDGWLRHPL